MIYIKNNKTKIDELLSNVLGYQLDDYQKKAVIDEKKNALIIAGAGSGKTLTIIGKIMYLIKILGVREKDILVLSFTFETVKSLKSKLEKLNFYNVDVLTFHKLGFSIIKDYNLEVRITKNNFVDFIVKEYLTNLVINDKRYFNYLCKYFKIYGPYNYRLKKYKNLFHTKRFLMLSNLFIRFINLYKTNDFPKIDISKLKKKEKYFLLVGLKILKIYEEENRAKGEVDFNDMLNMASNYVLKYGINKTYKYIIIDEFQDTSIARYHLIKNIIDKLNCHLICVGDDYQAIYNFTGCTLDIFINFHKYFGEYSKLFIPMTYRNSQQLINVAGGFICKNKEQIKKDLKSLKKISKPIVIMFYKNCKKDFKMLMNYIIKNYQEVLLLGRNNNDIDLVVDDSFHYENNGYYRYKDKQLRFLTIHKSKGLESEVVVLINLKNDVLGFPTKVKDERILSLILNNDKNTLTNEERRLFYVALTRTKTKVYLFVPYKNYSIFVKELLKDYKQYIEIFKN